VNSAAIILFGLATVVAPKPTPKPGEAFMTVSPRVALASPSRPATFIVRVTIPVPSEEFFCPSVEITVNPTGSVAAAYDVFRETHTSDCEPFSRGGWERKGDKLVDIPATEPWVWGFHSARKRFGLGPGSWSIVVQLTQGRRRVILHKEILVGGGEGSGGW